MTLWEPFNGIAIDFIKTIDINYPTFPHTLQISFKIGWVGYQFE